MQHQALPGQPQLVYAHALIPHAPFQAHPDCTTYYDRRLLGYTSRSEGDTQARIDAYGDQIDCVGTLLTEFAEAVPEDSVVIITGDHGSQFLGSPSRPIDAWDHDSYMERYGIFLAVHLPDRCGSMKDDTALVNAIRLATACAMGADLEPLDDRKFAFPRTEEGHTVVEITDLVTTLSD